MTWSACVALSVEYTLAPPWRREAVESGQQRASTAYLERPDRRKTMQRVKAGIKAIYLSGWRVSDNNEYSAMYRTNPCTRCGLRAQRLVGASTTPSPTLTKSSTQGHRSRRQGLHRLPHAPIVADAEAGFGGVLNAFELMKVHDRAGAAGVHWEDQLASVKKCGHMGGKVLVADSEAKSKRSPPAWLRMCTAMPTW